MFSTLFIHEVKYWLKKPTYYIYLMLFLGASTLIAAGNAGIFDAVTSSTGFSQIVNSPFRITGMFNGMTTLIFFLFPSIIGVSVYRDYKSEMHTILYSYPFSKANYLLAKFFASILIVSSIVLTIGIGMFIGFRLPGTNGAIVGAFDFFSYFIAYALFILPNTLLFGAIVFAVVTFTRNIAAGFITIIILLLTQGLVSVFVLSNLDNQFVASLFDPSGESAVKYYTEYWTVAEMNKLHLPIKSLVVYNRLMWFGISTVVFGLVYRFFSFSQSAFSFSFRKKKEDQVSKRNFGGITKVRLPKIAFNFSFVEQLKITWKLSNVDFKYIVKSWPFIFILLAGLLIIFTEFSTTGDYQGTARFPVTWKMLNFSEGYVLAIHICTFLYAGMLVRRAKIANFNQLLDTTPVSNWALLVSKLLALFKMQLLMLSIAMIAGLSFQIYKGYYTFEIDQYLASLFLINFTYFILWALLALFVQTMIKNPYLGLIVMIILILSIPMSSLVGIEQSVFKYGQGLGFRYSDMDGYGDYLAGHFIYSIYWLFAGLMFLLVAGLFSVRGLPQSFKENLVIAKSRFRGSAIVGFAVLLLAFLLMGFTIYYENNVKNIHISSKEREMHQVKLERKYKRYEKYAQPRIVSVKTSMNIFPKDLNFDAQGTYIMVNKTDVAIDSVFIKYTNYPTTLVLNKPNVVSRDTMYRFDVFQLEEALQPGDSLELHFSVKNKPNTLLRTNSPVRGNGTLINNKELYPSLGYNAGAELKDNDIRKKYGLPPNPLEPHPSDTTALGNHLMSRDADWIAFEATVSTSEDQIAIVPGYLQKEWVEEGRRYFHYKMDIPILNFYSFSSGRYEVARDKWNDVELEIYYHKGHDYNIDRMMAGMKAGLAYNSENFSPYQYRQARIIEFPYTIRGGAQGFPNTIPYSEAHGFIADVDDSGDGGVDYPFAVTVHEIAHQWWAHQVIGADVLGASMLTESLSDYVRLKVIAHQHGKSKMRTYLKYSLDGYLRKRGGESRRENPLMYNDGQGYIRYQKGALVFYAISDYIGEEVLNGALKKYVEKVQFQEAPYTTTIELVDHIREVTPDSVQYIIEDMFETITMYDNAVADVTSTELADGSYQVDIRFNVVKYRNDEKGRHFYSDNKTDSISYSDEVESIRYSLPLADYIDIGIFGEEGELYLRKHKITAINTNVTIIVDQQPTEVGIDPYNKLIDANSRDNRKAL